MEEWSLSPRRQREVEAFLRAHLPLAEVPGTGIRLHLAGPQSGLSRLVPPGGTPYWAHAWPGGVALALHVAARPELVRRRPVAEIGAGAGLATLAALRAGAAGALAADSDPLAAVAVRLNARANGLPEPEVLTGPAAVLPERLSGMAREGGPVTVLAGDVFYDERVARDIAGALDGVAAALGGRGMVLVGDIGRRFLPLDRLEPLAAYPVRDVGDPPSAPAREGRVFRWKEPARR